MSLTLVESFDSGEKSPAVVIKGGEGKADYGATCRYFQVEQMQTVICLTNNSASQRQKGEEKKAELEGREKETVVCCQHLFPVLCKLWRLVSP